MNNTYGHRGYYVPRNVVDAGTTTTDRVQARPMQNSVDASERARSANEQAMREMLRNTFCGLDTCSLICLHRDDILQSERRQSYFLALLESLCEEEKLNVFTSLRVYEELCELEARGDDLMKLFARRAIKFIERMNAKGLLMVSEMRSAVRVNADQELFLICSEEYLRNPVTVFTQDKALAEGLIRLNENRMMPHFEVMVRRVNMRGHMTGFDFAPSEPARQAQSAPTIQVVRDLHSEHAFRGSQPQFAAGGAREPQRKPVGQTAPAFRPRLQDMRTRADNANGGSNRWDSFNG
jgi:hypothetical protein